MLKWTGTIANKIVGGLTKTGGRIVTLQGADGFEIGTYLDEVTGNLKGGEKVEIDYAQVPKKTGGSYNKLLSLVVIAGTSDTHTSHFVPNPTLAQVPFVVDGRNTSTAVSPETYKTLGEPKFKGKQTSFISDEDRKKGQIKGNSVSNAVALAIARKGKEVTRSDILQALVEMKEVHKAADDLDW